MAVKGFEQLAQELPDEERKELLNELKDIAEDISSRSDINEDNIFDKNDIKIESSDNVINDSKYIDKIYKEVSVFEKIRMFFLKMFTKKSIGSLVQEYMLKKLGKEIESGFPGLADIKNNKLKEQLFNEIVILEGSLPLLSDPINYIGKNNVANFYRYVASREMSGFEELLKKKTNPEDMFITGSNTKESENIKASITRKFNELIDSIEPEEKSVVYESAKAFFFINKLVNFSFEALKKLFVFEPTGSRACSFNSAKRLLNQLDSIIASMSSEVIQFDRFFNYLYDYFLLNNEEYIAVEKAETETNEDFSARIKRKALNSITAINSFRKAVPLTKILKYIYKNINYSPAKISGGEEWFSLYKKLAKEEIDEKTDKFLFNQKKRGFLSRLKEYIPDISLVDSDYITLEHKGRLHPLKKCNALYYLHIFYERFYIEKIEKVASKFMIDGNFYKEANKKELTEAFNLINTFPKAYNDFIYKITHIDDQSAELSIPNQGDSAAALRRKKTDYLVKMFSSEGYKIYKTYLAAFISVRNVLGGIVSGTHTVEYDTLSNLSVICEEKSSMSLQNIDKLYRQFHDIINIITEYDDITQQQSD